MSKFLFSISFCAAAFFFSTIQAFGCTCMHLVGTVENEFKGRDAIFSGKVVKIVKSGAYDLKVTIKVENFWKGKASKTVTVSTAAAGSMCGYKFVKGKSYLIYAYGKRSDWSADICSRTKFLSDAAEDLETLNELSSEKESKTKSSPK